MEQTRPRRRSHRRRGTPPVTPPPLSAFEVGASAPRPGFGLLGEGRREALVARARALLSDYGVVVVHPGGHAALLAAGAREGASSDRLRFPAALIDEALAATPKSVVLCGKRPQRDLELPRADRGFVMRTGTGAHGFVEPADGRYRDLVVGDVATIAAVANGLDEVGFVAHPFVYGVPELTADIHGFAAMIGRTDKHCWIQPYGKVNLEYLMRIAAIAAGGEDALRRRPLASCIACSFSPLEFKVMDVEAIVQAGRYGLPIHACSLPSAGGTAPVTVPGLVLMAAAEILAMAVMAHVLAPGTAVIGTPLMFTLDMRTGRALQSCVESLQAAAMAIEVVKRGFGMLAHTYGSGSDTPDVDGQSMAERALLGQGVALAGADILGGVGQLECATVFSPVQAVLDNEIGGMLRHLVRVPVIDDESLDWPELSAVPVGGHFLASRHTLKYCRDQFQPTTFMREDRDNYEKIGRRTALDEARDRCLALIDAPPPPGLPDADSVAAIAEVVTDADRLILGAAASHSGPAEAI